MQDVVQYIQTSDTSEKMVSSSPYRGFPSARNSVSWPRTRRGFNGMTGVKRAGPGWMAPRGLARGGGPE